MIQDKKTYYVDITAESILTEPVDTPSFVIQATDQEVHVLQSVFEDKHKADLETYVRSHIPFREYHKDPENDHYDAAQKVLYAIIYHLGDNEARLHIDQMGILTDRKSDDPKEIRDFR
ncbi:hydrolase [Paenisporosarcina macmurdoensis]|uniref:Hydrolase n=1 Tax=Paenisporosarcina macmurdoensis TaxID=212659 RepID=A0ABW1L411_9BACL